MRATDLLIGEELENFDYARRPIKASERIAGDVPYLGASGVVDSVVGFTHEGDFLCVSEDGENLRSRKTPIAWVQRGRFWANNHLHVLGGLPLARLRFYAAALNQANITSYLTGSAQPKLSQQSLNAITLPRCTPDQQSAIGEVLGALGGKIATNRHVLAITDNLLKTKARQLWSVQDRTNLGTLLRLHYGKALPVAHRQGGDVTVVGSGGVVGAHNAQLVGGPCIVLGRKGSVGETYWIDGPAFPIDTTYWVEPTAAPLSYLYFLLKSIDFASMSSDSAVPGLNRERAYAVEVPAVSSKSMGRFEQEARAVIALQEALRVENQLLQTTFDELLPPLMSGKIMIKTAEDRAEKDV